jgi:hypothetical protein
MKIKYKITDIKYASVILVKVYSANSKGCIKLGISLAEKSDNRLITFTDIPDNLSKFNVIIQCIVHNMCRGEQIGKITKLADPETAKTLMYLCSFCTDEFVKSFISSK